MKQLFVLFAILQFSFSAFSQDLSKDWLTTDSKYISVSHPADYDVNVYGDMKIVMNGIEPREGGDDKFKENFGVIIKDMEGSNLTLDQFAEQTKNELLKANTNPRIEKFERIESPAGDCYHIEYRMNINNFEFYYFLRVYLQNGKGYSVMYTCENQRRTYHVELVETLLNSVKIKG